MPNGADKNFRRLVITVAAYDARFKDWPTELRMQPWALHEIAYLLDAQNFDLLANRLRLATTLRTPFVAGSKRGRVLYEDMGEGPAVEDLEAAEAWLGVRVRPECLHD